MDTKDLFPLNSHYDHFISLGYFCSVALELERIGLRSMSFPFDWVDCPFRSIMEAIDKHFADFLNADFFSQDSKNRRQYYNSKYDLYFVHDFDRYRPLRDQLPEVEEKYNRRIERFYHAILEPTLFIRYISDEKKTADGKSADLKWIEDNYRAIMTSLRAFNSENNIIFIANTSVRSSLPMHIYHVVPDNNDVVARKPLDKNQDLNKLLNDFNYEKRSENLSHYSEKMRLKHSLTNKIYDTMRRGTKKVFLREYIHDRQY